jgi:hypothetical protein
VGKHRSQLDLDHFTHGANRRIRFMELFKPPPIVKNSKRELRDRLMDAASRGKVTGVGMHSYADRKDDLYETSDEAVHAFLGVESIQGPVWECAAGRGAIVRVLREAGHEVIGTDLIDYGSPDSRGGVDFLKQQSAPDGVRTIVTNPPYQRAGEFVRHALGLVPHVAMLVRLAFLESQRRSDILDDGRLARVYPFANRLPMMHRDGWEGPKASNSMAFAWMVWDANHRGPWTGKRIAWRPL